MALDLGLGRKKAEAKADPAPNTVTDDTIGEPFRYTEFAPLDAPVAEPAPPRRPPGTQRIARTVLRNQPTQANPPLIERLIAWKLPVIGTKPVNVQVQVLFILLAVFALLVVAIVAIDNRQSTNGTLQAEIVGDTLMHTQRLAKAAPIAINGNLVALGELRDSRDRIAANLDALEKGDAARGLSPSSLAVQRSVTRLLDRWRASEAAASVIVAQEKALLAFGAVIKRINDTSPRLLQLTEEIAALKLQSSAQPREIAAAGQLVMLTQRLGRSANSMITGETANAEIALTLGRDISLFRDLTQALLVGSDTLGIRPDSDSEARSSLQELAKVYAEFQGAISGTLTSLPSLVQAKDAELSILRDSEPLRQQVAELAQEYRGEQRERSVNFILMALSGLLMLLAAVLIVKVLLEDVRKRAVEAEKQRAEAMGLEEEAKRSNEQNQAAILRLMNELQEVADGNLTVQATVTEDITGAIADSVNYTVEELRGLVGRINVAAEQVSTASTQARDIATRLLTASEAQSREIKDTGDKVIRMAAQINDVSKSASESA